jgi:hypothetical protein
MSTSLCCNPPSINLPQPTGLAARLQAAWQRFQADLAHQRQADALHALSATSLKDINAPDWVRRDALHRAEMEHYDRLRTLSQFRGLM